jgi:hypothetical protein
LIKASGARKGGPEGVCDWEIRSDIAQIREEFELRRIARRADAEHKQGIEDDD